MITQPKVLAIQFTHLDYGNLTLFSIKRSVALKGQVFDPNNKQLDEGESCSYEGEAEMYLNLDEFIFE